MRGYANPNITLVACCAMLGYANPNIVLIACRAMLGYANPNIALVACCAMLGDANPNIAPVACCAVLGYANPNIALVACCAMLGYLGPPGVAVLDPAQVHPAEAVPGDARQPVVVVLVGVGVEGGVQVHVVALGARPQPLPQGLVGQPLLQLGRRHHVVDDPLDAQGHDGKCSLLGDVLFSDPEV